MPTMTNNTVNISQLMEKNLQAASLHSHGSAKEDGLCKSVSIAQHRSGLCRSQQHWTQGLGKPQSQASLQTVFSGAVTGFTLSHPPRFFLGEVSGILLPRR